MATGVTGPVTWRDRVLAKAAFSEQVLALLSPGSVLINGIEACARFLALDHPALSCGFHGCSLFYAFIFFLFLFLCVGEPFC